jgi:hypothetical protein
MNYLTHTVLIIMLVGFFGCLENKQFEKTANVNVMPHPERRHD